MSIFFNCLLSVFSYLVPICYFLPFKLNFTQKITIFLILLINILLMVFVVGNMGILILIITCSLYIAIIQPNHLLNICIFVATYLFCVIWENLFSLAWYAFGFPVDSIQKNYFLYTIYVLLYIMLLFTICPFISRGFRNFIKKSNEYISKGILKLIVINLSVCVFIFLFNILIGDFIGFKPSVITFNCILFGCYFILSTVFIINIIKEHTEKVKMEVKQDSYDKLQSYTKEIEQMCVSLRSFKHDYFNIMLSMSAYIDTGDVENLQKYFYSEIIPLNKKILNNNGYINRLMNIGIIELKSLISAKLLYAEEIGIIVNIEVNDRIDKVCMDTIDLSRILGIFLDNGIEAALEFTSPILELAIIKEKDEIIFIVQNTYVDKKIPYSELKKPNVSTKGSNRGLGLYNVHNIISHYENVFLDTEITNDRFIQRLHIGE